MDISGGKDRRSRLYNSPVRLTRRLDRRIAASLYSALCKRKVILYCNNKESIKFMPNHKSAEKRDRQNARRNSANSANRTRLRTQIKKLRAALAAGSIHDSRALLSETVSMIDMSVQKGILHRNTAARHKARLTMHINKLALK